MASAHIFRATWSGTQASAEEIFAYKRHIAGTGLVSPQDVWEAIVGHVADLLATVVAGGVPVGHVGQAFPTDVVWTALKVAEIDPATDDYKVGVAPYQASLTGNAGENASTGLSLTDSLAITTRSADLGRRRYNRFYLPRFCAFVTDGKSRVDSRLIGAIIEGLQANQDDLAVKLDTSYAYCNFSPAAHTDKPFQDYYVGDVLDTQRRRRNSLVEGRTVVAA